MPAIAPTNASGISVSAMVFRRGSGLNIRTGPGLSVNKRSERKTLVKREQKIVAAGAVTGVLAMVGALAALSSIMPALPEGAEAGDRLVRCDCGRRCTFVRLDRLGRQCPLQERRH